jgi:uncharacterized protein YjbK
MKTNLEIEYKTLLTKEEYERVLSYFNEAQIIQQTNYYYQSTNSNHKKIASRIRQIGSNFELTFKIKQEKGKLEVNFEVPSNSVQHFNREDVQRFLNENQFNSNWNYIGELHTTRHIIQDVYGELCIDYNQYLGQEDYELEYEVNNAYTELAFKRYLEILNQFSIKNIKAKAKFHRFVLIKFGQD